MTKREMMDCLRLGDFCDIGQLTPHARAYFAKLKRFGSIEVVGYRYPTRKPVWRHIP